ncbi:MAG: hypothetical protein RLZZ336_1332 [Cyanobacteriota bacterium]
MATPQGNIIHMLQDIQSGTARTCRRLQIGGQLIVLRQSSLKRLEDEHERLQQFSQLILDARANKCLNLRIFHYAILDSHNNNNSVLYATHQAGLFSCWTTVLWSILEIQQLGFRLPAQISNRFGMDHFKNHLTSDTIGQWFEPPSRAAITHLRLQKPAGELLEAPNMFNHHGNYETIINHQLGPAWINAFLRAYMNPSSLLQQEIENFEQRYRINSLRTLVVCYRGTDKGSEVEQDSVSTYLKTAQQLTEKGSFDQVLIQTDQQQVQALFAKIFAPSCVLIDELPVTKGTTVLHAQLAGKIDIEDWALKLLAMVYACSRASTVITHTGNLGFFLAVMAHLHNATVIQLR